MNIFLVSSNPGDCARALDDLRLNKMILETGQMLCTAYRYWAPKYHLPIEFPDIYKETHKNHPCNVWLRRDINNYKWACNLLSSLAAEKYHRTGKTHLTFIKLFGPLINSRFGSILSYPAPKFTFDCSNVNEQLPNVFANYRVCLIQKWNNDIRKPTWTMRGFLSWCKLVGKPGEQHYQLEGA